MMQKGKKSVIQNQITKTPLVNVRHKSIRDGERGGWGACGSWVYAPMPPQQPPPPAAGRGNKAR